MTTARMIVLLVALGFALLSKAVGAQVDLEGYRPSAIEIMSLPKFCWGEFHGSKFKGPEYAIPSDTCRGMNHYCPGLVLLGRSRRSVDDRTRRGNLRRAEDQVGYAVRALEKYPRCPIRGEILQTYQIIERELSLTR